MSTFNIWYTIEEEDDEGDYIATVFESSVGPFATLEEAEERVGLMESPFPRLHSWQARRDNDERND